MMLRLVDTPTAGWWDNEVGDVWLCWNHNGSHDVEGRGSCWVVRLPGAAWHTNMEDADGGFWTVTGEAPLLTVHPSIFVSPPNGWHGWIKNGEMTVA